MASWERREVVTRHVEFVVPLGSVADAVEAALLQAASEYRKLHATDRTPDHYAIVTADDEHLIIRVDVPATLRFVSEKTWIAH